VLYHRHACEAVDEDSLLELADWAVRKLAYLNSDAHRAAAVKGESSTVAWAGTAPTKVRHLTCCVLRHRLARPRLLHVVQWCVLTHHLLDSGCAMLCCSCLAQSALSKRPWQ
jgi:hypothetical protein